MAACQEGRQARPLSCDRVSVVPPTGPGQQMMVQMHDWQIETMDRWIKALTSQ
jgi:hypothetical protein